ncbi:hypothetical protein RRG08_018312 [Elysia crispata]|uniref:Uncharacterized protein n=1 Tax=Elysia crispata TaxID=231223 RepID=A0AAE1DJQ1_9GAST|nr:hypothetical protein RRG08_018312 [Elysia crispata]
MGWRWVLVIDAENSVDGYSPFHHLDTYFPFKRAESVAHPAHSVCLVLSEQHGQVQSQRTMFHFALGEVKRRRVIVWVDLSNGVIVWVDLSNGVIVWVDLSNGVIVWVDLSNGLIVWVDLSNGVIVWVDLSNGVIVWVGLTGGLLYGWTCPMELLYGWASPQGLFLSTGITVIETKRAVLLLPERGVCMFCETKETDVNDDLHGSSRFSMTRDLPRRSIRRKDIELVKSTWAGLRRSV